MKALTVLNFHYRRYFQALFHPHLNVGGNMLTINEAIILSWPFIIVGVITNTVFTIYLTVSFFDQSTISAFPFINKGSLLTLPILLGLFWSLWGILLFPMRVYIYAFYIKLILSFYQRVSRTYSSDPTLADDIVAAAMSSNVFKVLPAFGDMVQSLAQFLCLYKGIKTRMQINSFAAFCILLTPAMLVVLLVAGILYSLFLLISL